MGARANRAPGPRFLTPLGFIAAVRENPLEVLANWWKQYGDFVEIRFGPWSSFLVVHPADVRHILHENHKNYWKGLLLEKLKRIAGEGLVFSDGDLWRQQRRLAQPAFHRDRIAALAGMMTDATEATLEAWTTRSAEVINVSAEASKLTLQIVGRALFGTTLGEDEQRFSTAVTGGLVYANHLINRFMPLPIWVPTRANRAARVAIATMDEIVHKIIDRRRRAGDGAAANGDLLGMLIEARDEETSATMNDRQLRDEVITFLVAGHETTAVTLSWTWHLLSGDAQVEARLFAEVDEVLGGRTPVLGDLDNLVYTKKVVQEAMRLYPPAWALSRQAYETDELREHRVVPNAVVTISPYLTHRHPEYWPDPERFNPERFSPKASAGRPEYAYFPFGGGPRRCIGNQFAMMEAALILAMTAQRFRLVAAPGHPVEKDPILTLRPKPGVFMHLQRRTGNGAAHTAPSA